MLPPYPIATETDALSHAANVLTLVRLHRYLDARLYISHFGRDDRLKIQALLPTDARLKAKPIHRFRRNHHA